jgi:arginine exporter protein ArgO
MFDVIASGLVTGWAIAVPIGAVGAFLVALTARTSWRVGAAGALGVASVDGVYAAVAVVGGAALAGLLEPVSGALRIASALALLVIAALTAVHAWATAGTAREVRPVSPARAYLIFLGITAVNPTTVVYFAAVILGHRGLVSGAVEGVVFVVAAFLASASWQLVLAAGGAALGAVSTGHRGRLFTGLVSAAVIAGLAIWTLLG